MTTTAFVKIWGKMVGAVAWDNNQQLGTFEYDKKFITLNWEIAPLKMPLDKGRTIFYFPELRQQRNSEFSAFTILH